MIYHAVIFISKLVNESARTINILFVGIRRKRKLEISVSASEKVNLSIRLLNIFECDRLKKTTKVFIWVRRGMSYSPFNAFNIRTNKNWDLPFWDDIWAGDESFKEACRVLPFSRIWWHSGHLFFSCTSVIIRWQ